MCTFQSTFPNCSPSQSHISNSLVKTHHLNFVKIHSDFKDGSKSIIANLDLIRTVYNLDFVTTPPCSNMDLKYLRGRSSSTFLLIPNWGLLAKRLRPKSLCQRFYSSLFLTELNLSLENKGKHQNPGSPVGTSNFLLFVWNQVIS